MSRNDGQKYEPPSLAELGIPASAFEQAREEAMRDKEVRVSTDYITGSPVPLPPYMSISALQEKAQKFGLEIVLCAADIRKLKMAFSEFDFEGIREAGTADLGVSRDPNSGPVTNGLVAG